MRPFCRCTGLADFPLPETSLAKGFCCNEKSPPCSTKLIRTPPSCRAAVKADKTYQKAVPVLLRPQGKLLCLFPAGCAATVLRVHGKPSKIEKDGAPEQCFLSSQVNRTQRREQRQVGLLRRPQEEAPAWRGISSALRITAPAGEVSFVPHHSCRQALLPCPQGELCPPPVFSQSVDTRIHSGKPFCHVPQTPSTDILRADRGRRAAKGGPFSAHRENAS